MIRSISAASLLVLMTIVILGMTLGIARHRLRTELREDLQFHQGGPPLNIDGLSFSDYQQGVLVNRINANKLYVRAIDIAGFRIKSVNELYCNRVSFEHHKRAPLLDTDNSNNSNKETSLGDGLFSSLRGLTNLHGIGRVVRGNIKDFTIRIFEEDMPHLTVHSESALLDLKKQQLRMINVTFSDPIKESRLTSNRVFFDGRRQLFIIPGKYTMRNKTESVSGENITVDVGFNINHLSAL